MPCSSDVALRMYVPSCQSPKGLLVFLGVLGKPAAVPKAWQQQYTLESEVMWLEQGGAFQHAIRLDVCTCTCPPGQSPILYTRSTGHYHEVHPYDRPCASPPCEEDNRVSGKQKGAELPDQPAGLCQWGSRRPLAFSVVNAPARWGDRWLSDTDKVCLFITVSAFRSMLACSYTLHYV